MGKTEESLYAIYIAE